MQQASGDDRPIDLIGTALMRATGVLAALTACQDADRGKFVLSDPFIMQAVSAVEGFIHEARNAYLVLCAEADMAGEVPPEARAERMAPSVGVAEGDALFESAETAMPEGNGQASSMLPGFYELRRRADFADRQVEHENYEPEDFAVSYDGLLRKLTAAEVFAAERSMTDEEANSPLLPLLKSLRHDLERLRAVA